MAVNCSEKILPHTPISNGRISCSFADVAKFRRSVFMSQVRALIGSDYIFFLDINSPSASLILVLLTNAESNIQIEILTRWSF